MRSKTAYFYLLYLLDVFSCAIALNDLNDSDERNDKLH